MRKEIVALVWKKNNNQNVEGYEWRNSQPWLGGKSCFSHTNPSNFLPLQSPLFEIYGWKCFGFMRFRLLLKSFFQKKSFHD